MARQRRNFETTARRFLFELAELQMGLRDATKEDMRDALDKVTHGASYFSAQKSDVAPLHIR